MIELLKNNIYKFVSKRIKPIEKIIVHKNSYSQAGEDVVLDFLLKNVGCQKPTYLELGVYYPDIASNTYKFYLKGARGVLVEADKSLIENIKKKRPEDIVLNVGVGVNSISSADFYTFDISGINTFDKKEAEIRQKSGKFKLKEILTVKLKTINEIIEDNFEKYPDFLSVDIEGLDLPVLKTLDYSKFPIPIICAETCKYSENHIKEKDYKLIHFLEEKGYFIYADTYINTIFIKKEWFKSLIYQR